MKKKIDEKVQTHTEIGSLKNMYNYQKRKVISEYIKTQTHMLDYLIAMRTVIKLKRKWVANKKISIPKLSDTLLADAMIYGFNAGYDDYTGFINSIDHIQHMLDEEIKFIQDSIGFFKRELKYLK